MVEIPRNQSDRSHEISEMLGHLRRRAPRIVEGESQLSEIAHKAFYGIWLMIKVILLVPVFVLALLGSIFLVRKIVEFFSGLM